MKKVLAILLALAMVFSFAACGDTKTEAKEETKTETGATAFKMGATGPLTGGASIYGMAVKNAAELAVKEVNAKGGVQIEFKMEDDVHDAEKAQTAYDALKDWGMQFMMGSVTSTPGKVTAADAYEDGYFYLTPSGSAPKIIEGKTGVFQMCFNDDNQGIASADFIAENMSGEKVAVIYKNDDIYSKGIYDKFVEEAKVKNVEIVFTATFTEETQTNFSTQVKGAKDAGATLVFLPIYYGPAALILTEANSQGYEPTWFGVDGMDGILSVENFNTALAEGVYLLSPFSADATDEKTVAFVKAYKEAYGDVPNQFAADAYDCVYAIYQALTAANCDYSATAKELCEALTKQFTTMSFEGLTGGGGAMTWDASGAVSKKPYAVIIKDGVYVGF